MKTANGIVQSLKIIQSHTSSHQYHHLPPSLSSSLSSNNFYTKPKLFFSSEARPHGEVLDSLVKSMCIQKRWEVAYRFLSSYHDRLLSYRGKHKIQPPARSQIRDTTFSAFLSACSCERLLDWGTQCFLMIGHHMEPTREHVGLLLSLLCRTGKLMEAEAVLKMSKEKGKFHRLPWNKGSKKFRDSIDKSITNMNVDASRRWDLLLLVSYKGFVYQNLFRFHMEEVKSKLIAKNARLVEKIQAMDCMDPEQKEERDELLAHNTKLLDYISQDMGGQGINLEGIHASDTYDVHEDFDTAYPATPFGTKEAPAKIKSISDRRIVGCLGSVEEMHDARWFWLGKDKMQSCPLCSQCFELEVVDQSGSHH